jgi:hypothetical protein
MSDPAAMRASDAEREPAADALREHFAAGRLARELERVQRELEHRGRQRHRHRHAHLPRPPQLP